MDPLPDSIPRGRPAFTLGEEIAHSVTHGVGVVLSLVGLVILVDVARRHGTTRDVVGCAVFGGSLVLLYTASTLYHSILVRGCGRCCRCSTTPASTCSSPAPTRR